VRTAAVAITAIVATVLGAGVAYAYWFALGSGVGAAQSGTALGLQISSVASGALVPGGTADVVVTIKNPNAFRVQFTSLAMTNTIKAYSDAAMLSETTSCTAASGVTWQFTSRPGAAAPALGSFVIAAGTPAVPGSFTLTLTAAAGMAATSDNSCQGQYFSMPITISAQSTSAAAGSSGTQA
jgi:hypothetical protein